MAETPSVDFKGTIKLGLISSAENYECIYRSKWEESLTLQQQLKEKTSKQEKRRKTNTDPLTKSRRYGHYLKIVVELD